MAPVYRLFRRQSDCLNLPQEADWAVLDAPARIAELQTVSYLRRWTVLVPLIAFGLRHKRLPKISSANSRRDAWSPRMSEHCHQCASTRPENRRYARGVSETLRHSDRRLPAELQNYVNAVAARWTYHLRPARTPGTSGILSSGRGVFEMARRQLAGCLEESLGIAVDTPRVGQDNAPLLTGARVEQLAARQTP